MKNTDKIIELDKFLYKNQDNKTVLILVNS